MSLPMMPPESNGNSKGTSKASESSQKGKELEDHFIDSLSEEEELPDLFSNPSEKYDENSRTSNKAQRSTKLPIAGIPLENISIPESFNSDSSIDEEDAAELPDFEGISSASKKQVANDENELKATDDLDDEEELDRLLGLFDDFDETKDNSQSSSSESYESSQVIESEPLLDSPINQSQANENETPNRAVEENLEFDEDVDSNDDQIKEEKYLEEVSSGTESKENTNEDSEEETIITEDASSNQSSDSSDDLLEPKVEESDESSILDLFELDDDDESDEEVFELSEDSKSILADSDDDEEEIVDLDFLDSIISSADDSSDSSNSDSDSSDSDDSNEEDDSQEYTLDSIEEDSDDLSSELNEYLNEEDSESEGIAKEDGESDSSDLEDEDFSSIFKEMGIDPNLLSDDDSSNDSTPKASESYKEEAELEVDDGLPDFGSEDLDSQDENNDFEVDPSQFDSTEYDEEDEDEDDDGNFTYEEEFTPPSNPFEVVPDNEQDEDDAEWGFEIEDDNSDSQDSNEEDKDETSENEENFDEDTKSDEIPDGEEDTEKDKKESLLLSKLGGVFSSAALKLLLTNYFDAIKAEMKGKDAPPPKTKLEEVEEEDEVLEDEDEEDLEENANSKKPKSKGKKKKKGKLPNIFGFLKPIKTLYLFVVNFFFKILTTVLGILSKIPIIGRFISPLLSMTKLLQQLANYLPIVVLIGALVLASFLSIPREHVIELPDSGGATFSSFKYDSSKEIAEGKITNTGEIIATVAPEFTVVTLQPELTKPKTWIVPQEVFKCSGDYTSVDIDSEAKVEVKCPSKKELPGYFPRVIGEVSE